MSEHPVPWSNEAEQAVLGAMLLEPAAVSTAAAALEGTMFYRDAHRLLFAAMLAIAARGAVVDPVTLHTELVQRGDLDRIGGMEYLGTLVDQVPTAANIAYHAQIVAEKAARRRLIVQATTIIQAAANGSTPEQLDAAVHGLRAPRERLSAARPPRFRLSTVDDLLALPAPAWLLERHLPENSLAVLYGAPGSAKSLLVLAWAWAIATGHPWLGHATRRGLVLYVSAEGGSGLGQRLQALRTTQGLAAAGDLLFVRETVNLLEPGAVTALLADVGAWTAPHGTPGTPRPEHPGLVVIDTMARCMPGGDENSAQDVGRVIAGADQIRQATSATVLLVHHTQKSGELERGSSALRGAADTMFALTNEEGLLTLTCTKQKDAPAVEPHRLGLIARDPSCVIEPLEGAREPRMTASTWKLLRDLFEVFEGGGSTMAGWVRVAGVSERSAYRSAKLLQMMGYITKTSGRYVVSQAGEMALKSSAI